MRFNTAIFYDLENLLKGYSFPPATVTQLSLTNILELIRQTGKIQDIALQRAYANWSDPRLTILRGEINELGIDPIQVFGFARDPRRNAADIQLAIDAIDLAHIRPHLDVFVIISGDGGFTALAKKLHEYGKTVIGCAYRSATSRTFQSVCDAFISLPDPEESNRPGAIERSQHPIIVGNVSDPRNVRMKPHLTLINSSSLSAVVDKTREILRWYQTDTISRQDLIQNGIHLSVVQEAVRYAVLDFESIRFGFAKFVEYMQFVCRETPWCIIRRPGSSDPVLALRSAIDSGAEILDDLDLDYLHSARNYRSLLAIGSTSIRLPTPALMANVARRIVEMRPSNASIESIIEEMNRSLGDFATPEGIKSTVLAFVTSDAFERTPVEAPISIQSLTLRPEFESPSVLIDHLKDRARRKLEDILGTVHDKAFFEIFPQDSAY